MGPVCKAELDFLPLPQDPYFQSLFLESEDDCSSMGQVYFDEIPLVPPNALELHIDEPSEFTNLEMQPETSNYRTQWSLKIEEIALSIFRKNRNLERCVKELRTIHAFQCTEEEFQVHFSALGIDIEKAYDPLSKEDIDNLILQVKTHKVSWSKLMVDFKRSPRYLKHQYKKYCKHKVQTSQQKKIGPNRVPDHKLRWSLLIEELAMSSFRKTKNLEACAKLLEEKHRFQCTAKEIQDYFTDLGIDLEKTYDPLSKDEIKKLAKEIQKSRVPWSKLMVDFKRSPRSLKCQYDRYCKRDAKESQLNTTKNISKYDSLPDGETLSSSKGGTSIRWSSKIEEIALAIFNKTKDLEQCSLGLKEKFKLQFPESEIQKHFTDLGIDMQKSHDPLTQEQIENLIKQVKERGKRWSKLMLEFKRSPRYLRYEYKRHCIGITRSNLVTQKQPPPIKTDAPLQTPIDLIKKKADVIKPINIASKRTFGQSLNLTEIQRLNQSGDHSEIRRINQSLINLVSKHNSNWEQIAIELSQEYQKTFTKESCYSLWLELDPKAKLVSLTASELFTLANLRVIYNDNIAYISQILRRPPSLIQSYLK